MAKNSILKQTKSELGITNIYNQSHSNDNKCIKKQTELINPKVNYINSTNNWNPSLTSLPETNNNQMDKNSALANLKLKSCSQINENKKIEVVSGSEIKSIEKRKNNLLFRSQKTMANVKDYDNSCSEKNFTNKNQLNFDFKKSKLSKEKIEVYDLKNKKKNSNDQQFKKKPNNDYHDKNKYKSIKKYEHIQKLERHKKKSKVMDSYKKFHKKTKSVTQFVEFYSKKPNNVHQMKSNKHYNLFNKQNTINNPLNSDNTMNISNFPSHKSKNDLFSRIILPLKTTKSEG